MINRVFEIVAVGSPSFTFRVPTRVAGLFGAVQSGSVPRIVSTSLAVVADLARQEPSANRTPTEAVRVLAFGAELAAAEGPEQAAQALESFASPVGT